MILIKNPKRVVIYFFFDKDGIVDDYVIYQLKEFLTVCERIVFVANGLLKYESRAKVKQVTDDVIVRENEGLDAWAYKTGIEYIGWDNIVEYDELILTNFTTFGPLYPWSEIFSAFVSKDVDCWSIMFEKNSMNYFTEIKGLVYYLASSIIVIRQSMLNTIEYREFWDFSRLNINEPYIRMYFQTGDYLEKVFFREFSTLGYKFLSYITSESDKLEGGTSTNLRCINIDKLLIELHDPFIRRKAFYDDFGDINLGGGRQVASAFEYINKHTNYDVNLIWDNLLRTQHMADLQRNLQLNYVVPQNITNKLINIRVAVIFHAYYRDKFENSLRYLLNVPIGYDIYITTDTEEKADKLKLLVSEKMPNHNTKVIIVENRGRDVSALLVGAKNIIADYELACFAHDKKSSSVSNPRTGEAFEEKLLENLLGSESTIHNIAALFDDNPRMGLLMPPPPIFGEYWQSLFDGWSENYEGTVKFLKENDIEVPISRDKQPIAPLGTCFWFRPKALEKLFAVGLTYSDFIKEPVKKVDGTLAHIIERVYPFFVQKAGYYSGYVLNNEFARVELTTLTWHLRNMRVSEWQLHNHINSLTSQQNNNDPLEGRKELIKSIFRCLLPRWLWIFMHKTKNKLRRNR